MKKHKSAHSKSLAILLSVSLLAGIVLPSVLSEDKAMAVSQNTTVYASKDKFVDSTGGYDNWPAGGRSYLYVGNQTSPYGLEQTAFSFNLSSIPGPITSAVLRLYPYHLAGTCSVNVYGSNNDLWSVSDSVVPSKDLTILTNQPTSAGGESEFASYPNSFNVTAFMEAQRTGDHVATLVLSPSDTSSINEFSVLSSEDPNTAYRPQLLITYTEPSASLSSAALTESNINGASVDLTLDAATFTDATLNPANFTVTGGAPFTISGVTYVNNSKCTLTMAYGGADFDSSKTFGIQVNGSEISTGSLITAVNSLTVAANNDAESLSLSGSAAEGSENGASITAAISGGQFAGTITAANWTVSNLPVGVSKGAVTRVDNTHVRIALSGNSSRDYDADITNVTVSCTSAEYIDSTGGGSLSANSGFTLTALNDAESLSIHDDGSILEEAEDGEVITAAISGGQFADTLTPANWSVSNLPDGVSVGSISRVDDTHAAITLSGNSTIYYVTDITNVSVSCAASEYRDSTGGGVLTANSGVTLTAVIRKNLILSASPALTEDSINGAVVNLALAGVTFAGPVPDKANYTVVGAPFTVSGVTYIDSTHVNLTLGYTGEDFDQDQSFSILAAGAELSDGAGFTSNVITVTAANDAESIAIANPADIAESAEDGGMIGVTISGGQFAGTITPSDWTVTGLPAGVSKGAVTRVDDHHVSIQLSGNATADYDSDITNVSVTCTADEYIDNTGDGSLTAGTGVVLKAVNDPESLSIRNDAAIMEGAEDGGVIIAELSGGQFSAGITPSNWTVSNLPAGVSKGAVTRVDDTHVQIVLSGNSTEDYDIDIADVTVSCTASEYNDNTGGGIIAANSGVTLTANNDPESISIGDDGLIAEGAEDGEILTVTLTGGQFAAALTSANWTVANLPDGVAKGAVTRVDDTHVRIMLSGNSTKDYDTDITNVTVACTASEYLDSTGGGTLSDSTGVTLTAVNDPESISIHDDGNIAEGAENGEIITVTLTGGHFSSTLNPANWTVAGLPHGVSKGTITRTDSTHAAIALSGNASRDYDSDITDVSVSCSPAEYADSEGGSSLSATGVTLRSDNDAETLAVSDDGLITEGHEDNEILTVTISGGQFSDTLTPANWTLSNLPDGVVLGTIARIDDHTASITLSGNSTSDYDTDITNVLVSCTADEYGDSTGDGALQASGVTFTAIVEPELVLTASVLPDESTINGAELNLRLKGMTFADAVLDTTGFTASAPFVISAVHYVDSTHCTLTVSYGGADFDSVRHLDLTVAGGELSTGTQAKSNPIDIAAVDDAESLAVQNDGNITEGAENGEILTAVITGGTFADTLTPSNWIVSNLPDGVTVGSVQRLDSTHAAITLSGNARCDYDADIDITVSCTADEYSDSTGGGSLAASGVTFTAVNDPESITIHDDGNITEGAENGELITVTLTGGQFAAILNPVSWTISNLPSGVSAGSITRTGDHTVTIALSGNTAADYDTDITNVSVSCAADQYVTGTDVLTASAGVTLIAIIEATPAPSSTPVPTAVPTAAPTLTPAPSATPVPTAKPTAAPTPAVTKSPTATPVPTKSPDTTATPVPTANPEATTAPGAATPGATTAPTDNTAATDAAGTEAADAHQTETAGPSKTTLDKGNAAASQDRAGIGLWIWILIALAGVSAIVIVVWVVRKGQKNGHTR